jgi:hypothetical protein
MIHAALQRSTLRELKSAKEWGLSRKSPGESNLLSPMAGWESPIPVGLPTVASPNKTRIRILAVMESLP